MKFFFLYVVSLSLEPDYCPPHPLPFGALFRTLPNSVNNHVDGEDWIQLNFYHFIQTKEKYLRTF